MNKRKILGIMALTREQCEYYLERYNRFADGENVRLISFTPRKIRWRRKRVKGFYYSDGIIKERWFPFPDAIYNQCFNNRANKITSYLGFNKVFNRINRFNKWHVYNILEATPNYDLKNFVPETLIFNKKNLFQYLDKHYAVFLKPCYGSFADNIYRIRYDKEIMKYHIYTTNTTPRFSFEDPSLLFNKINELVGRRKYIVQSEISMKKLNKDLFDIRMILQKDNSGQWGITTAFSRITPYRSIITNNMYKKKFLHELLSDLLYSQEKQKQITKNLYETSIKTALALEQSLGHLGEISVDFTITDQDEIKIIEVNGKPSKALIDELNDENIINLFYSKPIEYLTFLANKK
jgi:hypothetical protein